MLSWLSTGGLSSIDLSHPTLALAFLDRIPALIEPSEPKHLSGSTDQGLPQVGLPQRWVYTDSIAQCMKGTDLPSLALALN